MKNELTNYYLTLLGEIPVFLQKYLNVPCLVRLKKIGYFCGMDYASKDVYDFQEDLSRFDHSLTVALITWKFTNSKPATLAALFHDVATPCFSHVIDYMNKDYEKQESTEEYTEMILKNDNLLNRYLNEDNISIEDIIDFKKYPIVDNNRPKMCADRFDGIILTSIAWTKNINKEEINELVSDLTIFKNEDNDDELGFKNRDLAIKAVSLSRKIDEYCHSSEDYYLMELLALITRNSIEAGIFTYDDLYYLDEEVILDKIRKSKNNKLIKLLDKFQTIKLEDIPNTQIDGVKIRDLNPLVNNQRLL